VRQTILRLSVVLAAGAAVVLGVGGIASAHVSAHAPEATPGGFAEITFRVPTESDTASTVKLQVQLPTKTPLASVGVKPIPRWTVTTKATYLAQPVETDDGDTITDAVSQITWTAAAGQGVAPGQYQDLAISAGPLPKSGTLAFPAIQTYSDGTQVAWIEPTLQGQPEPQHPAPTVSVTTGVVLGAAGLLAALAALGWRCGGTAVALRRRRPTGPRPAPSARTQPHRADVAMVVGSAATASTTVLGHTAQEQVPYPLRWGRQWAGGRSSGMVPSRAPHRRSDRTAPGLVAGAGRRAAGRRRMRGQPARRRPGGPQFRGPAHRRGRSRR
jgi:uncharacterized protein YcnI